MHRSLSKESRMTASSSNIKWLVEKVEEHDGILKDLFETIKELKKEIELIKEVHINAIELFINEDDDDNDPM